MVSLKYNFERLRERVDRALRRSGRDGEPVHIVAVTKNVDVSRIEEAVALGHCLFGENRVQEAKLKASHFKGRGVTWHMIGHLQRNKVKRALSLFQMVQSLDSMRLASEVSKRASAPEKEGDLLLQVNTSGEESKHGIAPPEMERFLERVDGLSNIRIKGLMTIGPFTEERARIRKAFKTLRRLFEKARKMNLNNSEMCFLSMGMTSDFEIAIEEGSNLIRIGTALFGPREQGGWPN